MPITVESLAQFRPYGDILVETGTSRGAGVQNALDAGFTHVRSVEPFGPSFRHASARFDDDLRVRLFFGWSEERLWEMISDLWRTIVFWLDGHYSGDGTALGPKSCPLIEELTIISRHPIKSHVILIDDMRCWTKDAVGFGREEIEAAVRAINPAYEITYIDGVDPVTPNDILVARVPV